MSDRKMIYLDDAIEAVAEGLKHTYVEYRDVAEKMLKDVPSAQPTSCDTCQYNERQWDEEPCDSRTMGGETNHYKPSTQPEIVMCKDCKYFRQPQYSREYCGFHVETVYCNEDDFCSWAERRHDDHTG